MSENITEKTLYQHIPHEHHPQNANKLHRQHRQSAFNQRLAMWLTDKVNTMPTAYIFTVLAVVGLLGLLNLLPPFVFLLTTWISQQFLQLVFLPVLGVGQSVLGKHQEFQADEAFQTTQHSFHDIEQIIEHLAAQDASIIELDNKVTRLLDLVETRKRTHKSMV